MDDFPEFIRSPQNRVHDDSRFTEDVEGFVFDGEDGAQAIFWTCPVDRLTAPHEHRFDEYLVVVAGRYTLWLNGRRVELGAGEEVLIPRGTTIRGACTAGTRVINAFSSTRARRAGAAAGGGDSAHVRRCEQQLAAAHVSLDLETFDELLHPDYVIAQPDGSVQDKRAVLDSLASGERSWRRAEVHDLEVRAGPGVATVVGVWSAAGRNAGHAFDYTARFLSVWSRQAGRWRNVAYQAVETV